MQELRATHESEQRKQEEAETQRRLREEMREEERARAEAEKAKREADAALAREQRALDEARKQLEQQEAERARALQDRIRELEASTVDHETAVARARDEMRSAYDGKVDGLAEQVRALQSELLQAQQKRDRAMSMAEQTRRGHVYVISNVGSFGDNVFKIGMTRRLEPMDRVRELGDASVPFPFDVHALIATDDAPALELQFHNAFWDQRLNWINDRREFFVVSIEEIERFCAARGLTVELVKIPEAREYRQTVEARRAVPAGAGAGGGAGHAQVQAAVASS